MKCKCPSCTATLYVADEQLKGVKKPLFACPSCGEGVLLQPSKAACGKCGSVMRYYAFHFDKSSPIAKCPNCKTLNRLQL